MNWNTLKEFANSLDEKQLKQNVVLWREDEAIGKIESEALSDDHYMGEDDQDGCYPLDEAGLSIEEAKEQGLKKVYEKGHPILFEKF